MTNAIQETAARKPPKGGRSTARKPAGACGVTPLADRVIVLPDEAADKTPGGLLLPDSAKERPVRGLVVAVGPGKPHPITGLTVPTTLAVNCRVLYGRYSGNDFTAGGVDYKIMREDDVLAVLD